MTDAKRMEKACVLAGDVGGTKTRLSIYAMDDSGSEERVTATYASQTAAGLEEMIEAIIERHEAPVAAACFGIAGPVVDGASRLTNLSWSVSETRLRRRFGWEKVQLINDLAATAIAAPHLGPAALAVLNAGQPQTGGNMALVAPGTGLGQALLFGDRGSHRPLASEGGHADFAPTDDAEAALWGFLHQRFGHVSIERVLSGRGLVNIFEWLRSTGDHRPSRAVLAAMDAKDPAAVITRHAMDGTDALCSKALQRFCRILGAVAGNLALTGMATAGVYLGGGIPPKILPALKTGAFMQGFTAKGRFSGFMQAIPVRVIREDRAALIGAARRAFELAAA